MVRTEPITSSAACAAELPKLRVLDLFSGIGGFSLGLERTGGFKTVAFCEIAPTCRHLLNHHWPDVPCHEDVCALSGQDIGAIDVICGGFPCQDISLAGKGAGLAGERSGLWREYARLIGELRPRVVIVENVSALLVRGLGTVLGDLAALGYDAWWDCVPASAVGAPHRRDRLWIVAYAGSEQHEGFGDAFRRAIAAELSGAPLGDDADCEQQDSVGEVCGGPHAIAIGSSAALADTSSDGWREGRSSGLSRHGGSSGERHGEFGRSGPRESWGRQWLVEPDVGRVAHGVPARVDRLHGLGNAVVPEIPYRLGRAILQTLEAA